VRGSDLDADAQSSKLATLPPDGPTGTFQDRHGPFPGRSSERNRTRGLPRPPRALRQVSRCGWPTPQVPTAS